MTTRNVDILINGRNQAGRAFQEAQQQADRFAQTLASRFIGTTAIAMTLDRSIRTIGRSLTEAITEGKDLGDAFRDSTAEALKQIPIVGQLGHMIALMNTGYREGLQVQREISEIERRRDAHVKSRVALLRQEAIASQQVVDAQRDLDRLRIRDTDQLFRLDAEGSIEQIRRQSDQLRETATAEWREAVQPFNAAVHTARDRVEEMRQALADIDQTLERSQSAVGSTTRQRLDDKRLRVARELRTAEMDLQQAISQRNHIETSHTSTLETLNEAERTRIELIKEQLDLNLGQAERDRAAAMEAFTAGLRTHADTLGMTTTQLNEYRMALMDANAAEREAAQAAINDIAASERALAIQTMTERLEQQVTTLGMSRREIDLWRASQYEASAAVRDHINALHDAADARSLADDMQRRASQIFEATRTPLERYNEQLREMRELLHEGAIDHDTFNRRAQQLREGLEGPRQTRTGAARQQLRAEEGRFLTRATASQRDPGREQVQQLQKQQKELATANRTLTDMLRTLNDLLAQGIVLAPGGHN